MDHEKDMTAQILSRITVVLNETRYPENIGAAARACKNMGISRLRVVNPEILDMEKVLKMATHEARDIIEGMIVYDDLTRALSGFSYIVGTSARTGRQRRPSHTPRTLAAEIPALAARNEMAILFGSEKFGLDNRALSLCNALVTIPTTGFSSLNLAQSVMVVLYEIFSRLSAMSEKGPGPYRPRLATLEERQGMFAHLRQVFGAMGLFRKQPPEYWMRNAHRLLDRKDLTGRDVKTIRGFCRQVILALERRGTEEKGRKGP